MHADIIFDAIQIFRLVLKKIKEIFYVFLGKIEGNLKENRIYILNMSVNLYKSLET